jgi:hypothetical protein
MNTMKRDTMENVREDEIRRRDRNRMLLGQSAQALADADANGAIGNAGDAIGKECTGSRRRRQRNREYGTQDDVIGKEHPALVLTLFRKSGHSGLEDRGFSQDEREDGKVSFVPGQLCCLLQVVKYIIYLRHSPKRGAQCARTEREETKCEEAWWG